MCTVCGCSNGGATLEGATAYGHHHDDHDGNHHHHHHHDHDHHSHHGHDHGHHDDATIDFGGGAAGAAVAGLSQSRLMKIEADILGKNNAYARVNRERFDNAGILALNLVSSPGSGKTTLLCRTLEALQAEFACAVIEGDQQTSQDADRIRATGAPAIQINTGKGCHLDAHMVGHAIDHLTPADGTVLFVENVGNLVCPAAFDLGEAHKVAILSVTEGEDKPLKYPDMFAAADLVLINKIDLLPHLDFDVDLAIANARKVNHKLRIIQLSARSGEGMDAWLEWIRGARTIALAGRPMMAAQ